MKLEGVHHITAITGDAPRNVEFYAGTLGLRMVKKTVNQDDPSVYHLFYADEHGSGGADLTFFEYPGAAPGRAGPGMVHRIIWRVGSSEALEFWAERLAGEGVASERAGDRLLFADPEGMAHELAAVVRPDAPLVALHREVPAEFALQGFEGVRASSMRPDSTSPLLEEALEFISARGRLGGARLRARRHATRYDPLPGERGIPGAGTVHHIAFASTFEDHEAWGERVREFGPAPDARDRPLLLPLDLLPRARRRALRDRDARARLHRRRAVRYRSASASRCRRTSSTCGSASSRC